MMYRIGFITLLFLIFWGCGVDNGEKLLFDNAVLYFSKKVPENEAKELGAYLNSKPFDQQYRFEFKIDKDGGAYVFMIGFTDDQFRDTSLIRRWNVYASEVEAEFFNGKQMKAVTGTEYFKWR